MELNFFRISIIFMFFCCFLTNESPDHINRDLHYKSCSDLISLKRSHVFYVDPNKPFYLNLNTQLLISPNGHKIMYYVEITTPEAKSWLKYETTSLNFYGDAPPKGRAHFIIYSGTECINSSTTLVIEVKNLPPQVIFSGNEIIYPPFENFCSNFELIEPNKDAWSFRVSPIDSNLKFDDFLFWMDEKLLCAKIPHQNPLDLKLTLSDGEYEVTKVIKFLPSPKYSVGEDVKVVEIYGKTVCVKPQMLPNFKLTRAQYEPPNLEWASYEAGTDCIKIAPHIKNAFPLQTSFFYTEEKGQTGIKLQKFITRNIEYVMPFSPNAIEFTTANDLLYWSMIEHVDSNGNINLIWKQRNSLVITKFQKNGKFINSHMTGNVFLLVNPWLAKAFNLFEGKTLILLQSGSFRPEGLYFITYSGQKVEERAPVEVLDTSYYIFDAYLQADYALAIIASLKSNEEHKTVLFRYSVITRTVSKEVVVAKSSAPPRQVYINRLLTGEEIVITLNPSINMFWIFENEVKKNIYMYSTSPEKYIKEFRFVEFKDRLFIIWLESLSNTYSQKTIFMQTMDKNGNFIFRTKVHEYSGDEVMKIWLNKQDDLMILTTEIIYHDRYSETIDVLIIDENGNLLPSNIQLIRPSAEKIIFTNPATITKDIVTYTWVSITSNDPNSVLISMALYPSLIMKNSIPDVLHSLPKFEIKSGDEFYFYLSNSLFIDYDGHSLNISVTLNDEPLPDWMQYDPDFLTLHGTTKSFDKAEYHVKFTATDQFNSKIDTTLTLSVTHDTNRYSVGLGMLILILLIIVRMTRNFIVNRSEDNSNIEDQVQVQNLEMSSTYALAPSNTRIKPEDLEMLISQSSSEKIPKMYSCPITGEIMADPWILISDDESSSHSYEREAIQSWIVSHDTDPLTRQKKKFLGRNNNLRSAIDHFLINLTEEDMKNDAGLRQEIKNWIKRRGGETKIKEDTTLGVILEKLSKAEGNSVQSNELKLNIDSDSAFE